MIDLVDVGVNLTNKSLQQDIDAVMRRAGEAGVMQMVVTGTSIAESRQAIALCEHYDCVRAIGETGLDFNRNYSPHAVQEMAFQQQMELAVALQMPLFCHQRDAHERFVAMLREYRDDISRLVVHCFTDNREALTDYLDLDCYIGITGWICDERRGLELQQLVKLIPDNRLLLETDAPYLLPRNIQPRPPSRINEPAYLPHILENVAFHQGKTVALLARQSLQNSRTFFDL
jgi:TatD DNase family protein